MWNDFWNDKDHISISFTWGLAIQKKFESLLTVFPRCHSKYNSSEAVEDTEIDVLGTTKTLRSPIFYITCMSFWDSNMLSTLQLLSTETDIEEFVCFFRTSFPDASFPPKLHVLEEHVIPFMRKWHFPLGFFGEQGGESVHHEFVQLASTFSHVKPATSRLKKTMEEHSCSSYKQRYDSREKETKLKTRPTPARISS